MILYIVRHAWAEEQNDETWPDDSQRPLTKAGCRRRFSRLVKKLTKNGFVPGIVATSPFVRCQQTAELLAERVAGRPQIVPVEGLTPGSDLEALLNGSPNTTKNKSFGSGTPRMSAGWCRNSSATANRNSVLPKARSRPFDLNRLPSRRRIAMAGHGKVVGRLTAASAKAVGNL